MKQKSTLILILSVCLLNSINSIAKTKDSIITLEYNTTTNRIENLAKLSKINTGTWVQLVFLYNPKDSFRLKTDVEFLDKNMEDQTTFSNLIKFDKSNDVIKTETKQNKTAEKNINLAEMDDDIERKRKDTMLINIEEDISLTEPHNINKLNLNARIFKELITSKKFKLNENTMLKDLEIGDVYNFLNRIDPKKLNEKDYSRWEKAMVDYKWQRYLIVNLQKNLKAKITYRDSIIDSFDNNKVALRDLKTTQNELLRYYTPLFRIDDYDYTNINIEIQKKDTTKMKTQITTYNKYGFKIDFSTGLVFTGLYNKEYNVKVDDTNDSLCTIKDASQNIKKRFNMGIAIMAHGYTRLNRFFNPGFTTGLSYNINTATLNYFAGLSGILGSDQRIVLSGGIMAGKVKEMSALYKEDTIYKTSIFGNSRSVPMIDNLNYSWFIGISYNISSKQRSRTIIL